MDGSGRITRRNRRFIRQTDKAEPSSIIISPQHVNEPDNKEVSPCQTPIPNTQTPTTQTPTTQNLTTQTPTTQTPTTQIPTTHTQALPSQTPEPSPQTDLPESAQTQPAPPTQRRRTRIPRLVTEIKNHNKVGNTESIRRPDSRLRGGKDF